MNPDSGKSDRPRDDPPGPSKPDLETGSPASNYSARIQVALVEDDPQILDGLSRIIDDSPGFACPQNARFSNAEDAVEQLPRLTVEVVLMDIQLPGMSGIDCIRRLKAVKPDLQIMMLTVFDDHDRIFESLRAGATGYLLKHIAPAKLLEAIADLHRGGSPMSTPIARQVVNAFRPVAKAGKPDQALSPRQQQILERLARGHLYKEIADDLDLSVETVRVHIRAIYKKLHVRNRSEAANKLFGNDNPNPGPP